MVDQAIKFCYIVNHLLFQQQYLKIGIHNINLAYNERNHFYIFLSLPAHQTYKAVQRIIVYILILCALNASFVSTATCSVCYKFYLTHSKLDSLDEDYSCLLLRNGF